MHFAHLANTLLQDEDKRRVAKRVMSPDGLWLDDGEKEVA